MSKENENNDNGNKELGTVTISQEELNTQYAMRAERAKQSLLNSLGYDSVDALQSALSSLEAERKSAVEANAELEQKLATIEEEKVASTRANTIKEHLSGLNIRDNETFLALAGQKLTGMFNEEGEFDKDSFDELIKEYQEQKPFLFEHTNGQKLNLSNKKNPLQQGSKVAQDTYDALARELLGK